MVAATELRAFGGYRHYRINATLTFEAPAGALIERYICTASASGTLVFADNDGRGATTTTALAFTAGEVKELNIPVKGQVTITVGGTIDGILVVKG